MPLILSIAVRSTASCLNETATFVKRVTSFVRGSKGTAGVKIGNGDPRAKRARRPCLQRGEFFRDTAERARAFADNQLVNTFKLCAFVGGIHGSDPEGRETFHLSARRGCSYTYAA